MQPEEMASYIDLALFSGVVVLLTTLKKQTFLTMCYPNRGSYNLVWNILAPFFQTKQLKRHFDEGMVIDFIGCYD